MSCLRSESLAIRDKLWINRSLWNRNRRAADHSSVLGIDQVRSVVDGACSNGSIHIHREILSLSHGCCGPRCAVLVTVGPVAVEVTVGPVAVEVTVGPVAVEVTVGPVAVEVTVGPV